MSVIKQRKIFSLSVCAAHRVKRQQEEPKKEESFEKELCKDKEAGEWFRLVANDGDSCRDVIQCTSSVSHLFFEQKPVNHFYIMLISHFLSIILIWLLCGLSNPVLNGFIMLLL